MTEPRKLNVLIVEDENEIIKQYRTQLERIGNCAATIATSFADAERHLNSPRDFHLVILDLCIPPEHGIPASDDNIEQGRILLERCIARNEYPIPGLLIVTGYLEKTDQEAEREKIKREFYCAELLLKNRLAPGNKEIERAVERVRRFLDVQVCGERLKDREEYLVRRVAMAKTLSGFELSAPTPHQTTCLNDSPFDEESPRRFIGKPILPNGAVSSQEYYFSFVSSSEFEVVERRANDWAMGPSRAQILEKPRSNNRALFFYTAPHINAQSHPSDTPTANAAVDVRIGDKYVRVCDLVIEAMNGSAQAGTVISTLKQYDELFGNLHENYVKDILHNKAYGTKSWTRTARLILKVGAFGTVPETHDDKDRRRACAQNLEQIYTKKTGRRP